MFKKIPKSMIGITKTKTFTTYKSFAIDDFKSKTRVSFFNLRVIDDFKGTTHGFDWHPHRDWEIVTYVYKGNISHNYCLRDSKKEHPGIVKAPSLQYVSAGTGIVHTEKNADKLESRFLQLWFKVNEYNLTPNYKVINNLKLKQNSFNKLISFWDKTAYLKINSEVEVTSCMWTTNHEKLMTIGSDRAVFIYVIEGSVTINDIKLLEKDAVEITDELLLEIKANTNNSHFVIFETSTKQLPLIF